MNHGTCVHFNGLQNEKCKIGIEYSLPVPCVKVVHKSVRGGTYLEPGEEPAESKPFPAAAKAMPCPHYQEPTEEQVFAFRMDRKKQLEKVNVALNVALKVSAEWRVKPKPAADRSEVVECPVCKGRLHLSQSAYNGHVAGVCDTEGCVSWME